MTLESALRKICCAFVVWLLIAGAAFEQTRPSADIEKAVLLVNQKGQPEEIRVEFGLSSDFVVAEARLYYRPPGSGQFSQTKLKRAPSLRYVASIPATRSLDYFIELRPERGNLVHIGSRESPFTLDTTGLDRLTNETSKKKLVIVSVSAAFAATMAAILLSETESGKKRHTSLPH